MDSHDKPKTTAANTAKDPKPTSERIQQLANRVLIGDIVLPEFQRPFVWKRKQILDLLDSIYRNYPIGSMLVWESRQELASKRSIADLAVGERSEEYPVNYLLDGQQRLSTVCGVLHWKPGDGSDAKSIWNVAFDLKTQKFAHTELTDSFPLHQIPLRRLSDPSSFYRNLAPLDDDDLSETADLLFNRFKDYQVPLVTLGDMSIHDVAPVFERINSTGTRLTLYDLMRAATWSPDFDLGKTVADIKQSLAGKHFSEFDEKTFLRALGAAAGPDFSKESIDALRQQKTADLTAAAQTTKESAKRAADFLSTQVGVPRSEAIPYANQFAVLCEVFRVVEHPTSAQLAEIRRWFWRTTLAGYFGGWDNAQMSADAKAIRSWGKGDLTEFTPTVSIPRATLWSTRAFRSNSAVSKMAALMFAHEGPVDILNGQKIDTGKSLSWSNDKEYHHFFPQAFLRSKKVDASRINAVANMVMLTSASNIKISDKAPSEYLGSLIESIGREALEQRLALSMVSADALDAALSDDYEGFLSARANALQLRADELAEVGETALDCESDPALLDDSTDDSGA